MTSGNKGRYLGKGNLFWIEKVCMWKSYLWYNKNTVKSITGGWSEKRNQNKQAAAHKNRDSRGEK